MIMPATNLPQNILIIGSGVFGLSIALELARRPKYRNSQITLLEQSVFPNPSGASVDTTRIIRADYATPLYADLARQAQALWRQQGDDDWGGQGRYTESGLCLVAEERNSTYVRDSLINVRERLILEGIPAEEHDVLVRPIHTTSDLSTALRLPNSTATSSGGTPLKGYLNRRSGWGHAENGMRYCRGLAERTGRITFVHGEAAHLLYDSSTGGIAGAALTTSEQITADLTILAAGAWTPKLLDLRGVASARAQCMAYLDLSESDAARLKDVPVCLDLSSGGFFFPPTKRKDGAWEMKVARHAYGYTSPTPVDAQYLMPSAADEAVPAGCHKDASREQGGQEKRIVKISLPSFPPSKTRSGHAIPAPDEAELTATLRRILPLLFSSESLVSDSDKAVSQAEEREFSRTRLCHYLDTENGDYLVCPVPRYSVPVATTSISTSSLQQTHTTTSPSPTDSSRSAHAAQSRNRPTLFLATAGSGHAFKFLPVLGAKCVDVLEGYLFPENAQSDETIALTRKWRWRGNTSFSNGMGSSGEAHGEGEVEGEVWCEDGSRAGEKGLVLSVALGLQ